MLAAIYTLGCKVNQYETQAMEQELVRRGHTLVPFDEKADVYIVNTCSVTAVSDKKSRQMLRRCRKLNPEAVSAAAGDMRLRLGSLEPRTITDDFCRRAAALPNLCPHFHLSLQSGCDETLKRMNRKYDTARFRQSVALLNRYFHRPAVTTDLICGFPEETEEEFTQTLAFIRDCGFAAMHIFPYSIRPGTKAAAMEQVPPAVKEERAARAAQVAEELHRAYLNGCVGQVYPVLFEQVKDGLSTGHAPNYMEVAMGEKGLHNIVRNVKIISVENDMLRGEFTS